MAVTVYKTFTAGEVLTATDLNNSFTQVANNDGLTTGGTITGDFTMSGASIVETEGAAVASATTTNIWATDGNTVHITGTTTITSFGTAPQAGAWMKVVFDDALTLTHAANLNLPGSANITTAAGDFAFVYADTTTQFDVLYFPKSGAAVVQAAAAAGTLTGTTLAANVVSSSLTSVGTIATGVWQGTAIGVAYGGTGLASGTSGGVLAYTAAGTLASSAALAANQIVLGGGAGVVPATLGSLGSATTVLHGGVGAPTFGAVSLTADVSGILPTANGGTGIAYFTAAGPTTARIYTFPDAAATILYDAGALGTPASGTLTNCTGLPQAGTVGLTTGDSPQFTAVNVGHATDTTLARAAAGIVTVEGNELVFNDDPTLAAHATTMNPWRLGSYVTLTGGAVTFTALTAAPLAGAEVELYMNAAHVFTDGAVFEVDGDTNFTAEAGDRVVLRAKTTTLFTVHPIKKTGTAVVGGAGFTAASQAEQEAASSTTVGTTPGRQHFHPGHPKVWGQVTGTGTPALSSSYNVTSIADTGTGIVTVTIATDFSSTNYCVVGAVGGGNAGLVSPTAKAAGTVEIRTLDSLTQALSDFNPGADWAMFGDQA